MLNYKKKLLDVPPVGAGEKPQVPEKKAAAVKESVSPPAAEAPQLEKRLEDFRKALLSDLDRDLAALKAAVPAPASAPAAVPVRSRFSGLWFYTAVALAGLAGGILGLGAGIRWMDARLKPNWQKELSEIQNQASLKLDRFFSSREIQVLLEEKSVEHARKYVEEKTGGMFQAAVAPITAEAGKETARMRASAEAALTSLQELENFDLLVTQAKNDDRLAFEKLLELSRNRGHRFREMAGNAISQIYLEATSRDNLARQQANQEGPQRSYLSLEDFTAAYENSIPLYRPALLSGFWSNAQFTDLQKLDFLMHVVRQDKSLQAMVRACVLMDEKAKIGKPFTAYDKYVDWWAENRSLFLGVPSEPVPPPAASVV